MKLCYLYIKEYKKLKNVSFSVDNRYTYSYDSKTKLLKISTNDACINGFWDDGISSLACLVGENGAGKTSILEVMIRQLINGYADFDNAIQVIVVYENQGELHYWSNMQEEFSVSKDSISCRKDVIRPHFSFFYYSGHFAIEQNATPTNTALSDVCIASDGHLLVKDYQDYLNKDNYHMHNSLRDCLIKQLVQNSQRICTMLSDEQIYELMKDYFIPEYLIISPNTCGIESIIIEVNNERMLSEKYGGKSTLQPPPVYKKVSTEGGVWGEYIHHNLLNYIDYMQLYKADSPYGLIDGWKQYRKSGNTLNDFEEFAKDDIRLSTIAKILKELAEIVEYNNRGFFYIPVVDKESGNINQRLFKLNELLNNSSRTFLTARVFDISYSRDIDNSYPTTLSSGEMKLLNLFSRIYDCCITHSRKFGSDKTSVFLLDEAEMGFHPEWQLSYVKLLNKFMSAMYRATNINWDFQIIITTHHPISLSDVPSSCVTFLENVKSENGEYSTNYRGNIFETFGANVFDLFRNSFFMKNGLIGEFAKEKIHDINSRLDEDKDVDIKEINMIGDDRIRMYLLEKKSKTKDGNMEALLQIKKEYQKKIKELDRKISNE